MSASKLTREEILRLEPAAAFADGLCDPAAPPDAAELAPGVTRRAVPALVDQLRAAYVHEAVLGAMLTALDQALTALGEADALDRAQREALGRALRAATGGDAAPIRWMDALGAVIATRRDVRAAIRFLERARTLWMLKDQLESRGGGSSRGLG